jgi:putative flippase GtrA
VMAGNRQPITQPSIAPTTKVAAGGAAGALTVLVVWILGLLHVPVPPEVASAITVLISFITSYFVRQRIPAAAINPGTSGG